MYGTAPNTRTIPVMSRRTISGETVQEIVILVRIGEILTGISSTERKDSRRGKTMKLIKLTTLEKRDIAVVADEVISIEKGDYLDCTLARKYDFRERPTRVILKHHSYAVREDFDTVCALMRGAEKCTV